MTEIICSYSAAVFLILQRTSSPSQPLPKRRQSRQMRGKKNRFGEQKRCAQIYQAKGKGFGCVCTFDDQYPSYSMGHPPLLPERIRHNRKIRGKTRNGFGDEKRFAQIYQA